MAKFGRNYSLAIQFTDATGGEFTESHIVTETLNINPPFTLNMDITRNNLPSASYSTIQIMNLGANTRNLLKKAPMTGNSIHILLLAGYGTNLPTVFEGWIYEAWSVREGVNFVTTIRSFDGGEAFTQDPVNVNIPFSKGTAQTTVIRTLMETLPGVRVGKIGNYTGSLSRDNAYSGSATELLREVTGGGFFIDNNTANALAGNEVLVSDVPVLSAESGLIGTPLLEYPRVIVEIIFEPKIIVGQRIYLDSSSAVSFNGFYKVVSIQHRVMISPTVCGDAITVLGLLSGSFEDV